jgi:hypothetical protein
MVRIERAVLKAIALDTLRHDDWTYVAEVRRPENVD